MKNGEIVAPNSTGINVSSSDVITVTITSNTANANCIKNMSLHVSATKANITRQEQQSQIQQQIQKKTNKSNKDHCSLDGYKKVSFSLKSENIWVCSFKVNKYWKRKESISYIFLCHEVNCNKLLSGIDNEVSKYTFYLVQ
jgi:hypothetical protein